MTTFITFKQFDIIYLLTQQRGYMTGATLNTVITYVTRMPSSRTTTASRAR